MVQAEASLPDTDTAFEALLHYIRQERGFDFTGYKRSSLIRRLRLRMQTVQIEHFSDYIAYLKVHPEEFVFLFNTIEINYTSFFRDAEAWKYITDKIIRRIIVGKSESDPIRAWSAGCASGEETYTLAMLLAEALGVEQFQSRVKVYATDVDEEAINQARLGSYLSSKVVDIPPTLLERYFERASESYVFRKDLRRSILFCRHNMIQDAPMSKIDLLVCRNALIYFNIESQTRALARFHFSLKESGSLFLGKAEMLPTYTNFFTPRDLRHRVFTKVPRSHLNQRQLNRAVGKERN